MGNVFIEDEIPGIDQTKVRAYGKGLTTHFNTKSSNAGTFQSEPTIHESLVMKIILSRLLDHRSTFQTLSDFSLHR